MRPLPISDDLWLCESALYLPRSKTLVVADLQLGQEQQLRAMGHNIMYEQGRRMFMLLDRLLRQTGAETLVINGDLKHDFRRISRQERRDITGMLRELGKRAKIVIVRGNHDTITQPLADELGAPFLDAWSSDGVLCVHGHEEPSPDALKGASTVVIGHLHPAVVLHDGVRRERYKCFLVGRYRRKRLVVLPSFTTMTEGIDVLTMEGNSPLLSSTVLDRAEVYVLADEVRRFGQVSKLRTLLQSM